MVGENDSEIVNLNAEKETNESRKGATRTSTTAAAPASSSASAAQHSLAPSPSQNHDKGGARRDGRAVSLPNPNQVVLLAFVGARGNDAAVKSFSSLKKQTVRCFLTSLPVPRRTSSSQRRQRRGDASL